MNQDRTTAQTSVTTSAQSSGSSSALSPQAVSYIAGIVSVALLAAGLACFETPPSNVGTIFVWILAALVGELMLFPTLTGRGHISLSTTMHLAMVFCLDPGQLVAAILISRGLAMFVVQRQIWYRALFNVTSVMGGALAASYVFRILVGDGAVISFESGQILRLVLPFLASAVVYYGVCAAAASGILALTTRDLIWRVWRENFGYAAELVGTVGLILLAPVMVLCFQTMGGAGLIVFLVPMVLVRMTSVRYIALRQSQGKMIAAERLAAKGEIAAEVGHDIKNFLQGISAQLYFLETKGRAMDEEDYYRRIEMARAQLEKANALSEGLMAFTCQDGEFYPARLTHLIESTVRFLSPQRRFEGVNIDLDLDRRIGEVVIDSNQIQQLMMNLMMNAANAMYDSKSPKKNLWVTLRLHEVTQQVELLIADSGPGVSSALRAKIFEPGFTTRDAGHGFGLATAHRVVTNHEGTIELEENPGGGALFRVLLPANRESDVTRRAA